MGSRPRWKTAGAAAAIVWLGVGEPSEAVARIDVAVRQFTMPDGTVRYAVPVTIGESSPIMAELDTGSFGLRVLTAAVPASAIRQPRYGAPMPSPAARSSKASWLAPASASGRHEQTSRSM